MLQDFQQCRPTTAFQSCKGQGIGLRHRFPPISYKPCLPTHEGSLVGLEPHPLSPSSTQQHRQDQPIIMVHLKQGWLYAMIHRKVKLVVCCIAYVGSFISLIVFIWSSTCSGNPNGIERVQTNPVYGIEKELGSLARLISYSTTHYNTFHWHFVFEF